MKKDTMYESKLYFIIFSLCIIHVEPFASWLMPKCLTSIRDPTNIIMNHFIVPMEMSRYLDSVNLEIRSHDTGALMETILENGRHVLYLDANDYELDRRTTLKFKVTIDVQSEELQNLEYVLDVISLPKPESQDQDYYHYKDFNDRGDNNKALNNTPKVKGIFTSQSGCSGSRAYGKHGEKGIDLEITVTSLVHNNFLSDQEIGVDIVAGWAKAHEEVTLTRSLVILFRMKSDLEL